MSKEDSDGDPVRILVIDDEEAHAHAVAESLARKGYDCDVATSGAGGTAKIAAGDYEIVITDLMLGDTDGLAVLQHAREQLPDAEVILITGHGSISNAVEAMQAGAATYLTKPLNIAELRAVVERAARQHRLARSNVELKRQLDEKFGFEGVIGNSASMNRVLDRLKHVAPTPATVLILGENGTGKELVARALHTNSPRKHKPFVALNCAALSEGILESELFGHEKGAYTGADKLRKGRFEYANGGTLFLDEVGDLPMDTQIKLLRVIESREINRVGSNEPIPVNVRLLSATNRDIQELVAAGKFREDLYYRLKVVTIQLPPLRERREDIPLLIDHFLKDLAATYERPVPTVSGAASRVLRGYDWPGNVRQLRNAMESTVVIDTDGRIDLDDLPDELQASHGEVPDGGDQNSLIGKPMDVVEAYYIEQALKLTDGNRKEAAAVLGIGERTLYRKIDQYDIPNGRAKG